MSFSNKGDTAGGSSLPPASVALRAPHLPGSPQTPLPGQLRAGERSLGPTEPGEGACRPEWERSVSPCGWPGGMAPPHEATPSFTPQSGLGACLLAGPELGATVPTLQVEEMQTLPSQNLTLSEGDGKSTK